MNKCEDVEGCKGSYTGVAKRDIAMFTYEEATAFVVSNFRRAADAHDAGRLQEIEAGREIKNPRVLAHFALRPRERARSFRRRRGTRKALVIGCLALAATPLVVLYVVPLVFQFTGWLHHSEHEFSGSLTLDRPPEQVYELLTDYERLPEWFSPCESVEIRRVDDHTLWVATFANGEVASVLGMAIDPPRYLIWRFTSENRHVSAMWEFQLTPQAGSTQLSLKTGGVAHHWIYRITSQSIIDDEAHIREFLDALATESGQPLEPQRNEES